MTRLLFAGFFILFIGALTTFGQTQVNSKVFTGTVIMMSPPTFPSGVVRSYRIVKYRIETVDEGELFQKNIVVDHLILNGKELQGVKVGSRLRVTITDAPSIETRTNFKGIRSPSEKISRFYIARKISRIPDI